MNEELKIIIGADVANFNGGVINVIKTIGELESELKQFQKEIKTLTGDEFLKMSDKIATAKANIAALKSIGSSTLPKLGEDAKKAAEGFDKLAKPTNSAGYALSNLGRVAQDAPFGFIAIQNNLSPLLESFQSLQVQTGSTKGALKALGSSLLGGAGIGFAFSVITSTVTTLIQNYGSLGNAIDVIFAKNKQAAEATATYNKELEKGQGTIGAEIATIDILTKRLTNLQAPYKSRQDAYNELKKIQPDILRGMSEENALSASSVGVILGNAKARKELLLIKLQENAIGKVLDENAAKELQASIKLRNAKAGQAKIEKDLAAAKEINKDSVATRNLQRDLTIQNKQVEELQKAYDNLNKITVNYTNQLDPLLGRIAEINNETQKGIDKSKADAEAKKKQTKESEDLAAANEKLALSTAKQNAKLDEGFKIAKEAAAKAGGIQAPVQNPRDLKPLGEVTSFQGSVISENLLKEAEAAALARVEYEKYAVAVSSLVAPAIDQLFTSFENGKNIFQALSETIKSLVIDIAKAIVKATILKGITSFIEKGGGAGFFGGLFNLLGGSLGGVAAPTFGGGAGLGGGLALNGEVIFVQRGTDLVGVLNRGNSQINRVG
jgi:hypothetical protein